ncbi:hypothetical protein MCEREM30_03415 [Paracoccaceae bacterium]
MASINWEKVLVDSPIKRILTKRIRKAVDLEEAAKGMDCFDEFASAISKSKGETPEEQTHWKGQYISKSLLDVLISQKGGFKTMIEISEKSPPLSQTIDQIEHEYTGKRMTMKRITDPDRALAAEKLLKARVARRNKLAQPT